MEINNNLRLVDLEYFEGSTFKCEATGNLFKFENGVLYKLKFDEWLEVKNLDLTESLSTYEPLHFETNTVEAMHHLFEGLIIQSKVTGFYHKYEKQWNYFYCKQEDDTIWNGSANFKDEELRGTWKVFYDIK